MLPELVRPGCIDLLSHQDVAAGRERRCWRQSAESPLIGLQHLDRAGGQRQRAVDRQAQLAGEHQRGRSGVSTHDDAVTTIFVSS
jgi:hypothetical protein